MLAEPDLPGRDGLARHSTTPRGGRRSLVQELRELAFVRRVLGKGVAAPEQKELRLRRVLGICGLLGRSQEDPTNKN